MAMKNDEMKAAIAIPLVFVQTSTAAVGTHSAGIAGNLAAEGVHNAAVGKGTEVRRYSGLGIAGTMIALSQTTGCTRFRSLMNYLVLASGRC